MSPLGRYEELNPIMGHMQVTICHDLYCPMKMIKAIVFDMKNYCDINVK
jgi:hypothetical protein